MCALRVMTRKGRERERAGRHLCQRIILTFIIFSRISGRGVNTQSVQF